jgi:hypothetical protein
MAEPTGTAAMMKRLAAALFALCLLALLSPAHAQFACPDAYAAGRFCTPITGNNTGTTGAVVGSLAASTAGKTTFLCGFSVDAIGGTAAVGPITVAGLVGSSMTFQLSSSATGAFREKSFAPCLAASAPNTAITISTTANGTATAVDVNSSGYQQ